MEKPKLLDDIRTVLRLKHYSIRTEQAYIHWITRFIFFHHKRHPKDMRETEIRNFLSYLATYEFVALHLNSPTSGKKSAKLSLSFPLQTYMWLFL